MNQRLTLLAVWLSGYVVCLVFLFIFLSKGWMLRENFKKDFGTATAIFTPYLTPIIAFWFVKRKGPRVAPKPEAFYIAVIMSIIFVVLILIIVAYSFFQTGEGVIEDNLDLALSVGAGISFLVGPAMGYYFGKAG